MNVDLLNPHPLAQELDKNPADFTKDDIIRACEKLGIRMLNLRYVAGDGRLKKLNFVLTSRQHLDHILTFGERVDGSSLFPYLDARSSDVYVVPRFRTAFLNPFSHLPALDLLCSFYGPDGQELPCDPSRIVAAADHSLHQRTGTTMEALGELEFYIFDEVDRIYPITPQHGYHESHPFSKWGVVRREAMAHLAAMGCPIKYGHAEVGNILADGREMVQGEIEFLPAPLADAADHMVLAKWVLREVAYSRGLEVSFAPKIVIGHAGSGMHVHTKLLRDGRNAYLHNDELTDDAHRVIAGFLRHARSLSAFANRVPTSYLRLVPHQEAPTSLIWGHRDRGALVRVPLGWSRDAQGLMLKANPHEPSVPVMPEVHPQTIEVRSPDGSAHAHLLLAALAVAAREGLTHPDSLEQANAWRGDVLPADQAQSLPASCVEAADCLLEDRATYELDDVFPAGLIDGTVAELRSHDDANLAAHVASEPERLRLLIEQHLHCG